MKLLQLIMRFEKEYKPTNPKYKLTLDKQSIYRLKKKYGNYAHFQLTWLVSDIATCFTLETKQYNLYEYIHEQRKIEQVFDLILKLYFKEDLEKLFKKYNQLNQFIKTYYNHNNKITFCHFMLNKDIHQALNNNTFLISALKEKYKNIVFNKLFN